MSLELASDLYGTIAARMNTLAPGSRSWGFTSTSADEGASTVALGTALALASLQSERVLLIDANWISPSLSSDARTTTGPDLEACLRSKARLADAARGTRVPGLFFVSCPALSAEPPLGILPELVADATSQFKHVLVDLPPIIPATASVVSWSAVLSDLAVVVRRDVTRRAALRNALDAVAGTRPPVVIFNAAKGNEDKGSGKRKR